LQASARTSVICGSRLGQERGGKGHSLLQAGSHLLDPLKSCRLIAGAETVRSSTSFHLNKKIIKKKLNNNNSELTSKKDLSSVFFGGTAAGGAGTTLVTSARSASK
jgi:hypothetical protein